MALKDEASISELILVPNSGVQFVTLKLNIDRLNAFSRKFIERREALAEPGEDGQQLVQWQLLRGWNSEDPQGDPENEPVGEDIDYDINKLKALEPFLEKWVPVPYLRVDKAATSRSGQTFDDGPTNWVRVRVTEAPEDADHADATHLATFAFDTMIDSSAPAAAQEDETPWDQPYVPYTEPRAADIETPRRFAFVAEMDAVVRFLADYRADPVTGEIRDYQRWVVNWLEELFTGFLRANKRRQTLRDDDFQGRKLEHVARWITFLELLSVTAAPSEARFVDTLSNPPRYKPVDVDLVLDVGNSRTCGILIEDLPNQDDLGIEGCQTLEIRDVEQPHLVYREPFESHVEFSQASFGPENLSRDSGRTRAFFWPSLVRVGPEARQLRNRNGSMDDLCGMSSPKRYLWDVAEMNQAWRFPGGDYVDGTPPPIGLKIRKHVNASGDIMSLVTSPKHRKIFQSLYPARNRTEIERTSREYKYSRSAIYTFMLAEVIWQAFVMINNPVARQSRSQSEVPRQLRNIILTLPTSVPTREQRIMKMRAEAAVSLIWDLLDWSANPPRGVARPGVKVAWDEASCVQLVWLYGEIAAKFGDIDGFFKLVGRPRQPFETDVPPAAGTAAAPSLRIASLDIGGGTTDLMITTYFHEDNRAINPVQTFRESFRIAGDDVARSVIERIIVPAFISHLTALGVPGPRELLKYCFNNHANITKQETNQRRLFVQRVFLPIAHELMARYEQMTPYDYGNVRSLAFAELVPSIEETGRDVTGFIEAQMPNRAEVDLRLDQIRIPFSFESLRHAIQEPLEAVMDNLCEAIGHFDCDIVILSGRPSRLPAVREMVYNRLSVPVNRIVALHDYRPGNWYPFRSHDRLRLGDPKTAAVVGGTLCALSADGRLRNFLLFANKLQMRSTAKYIGRLESNNKLLNQNIVFSPEDFDDGQTGEIIKEVLYYTKEFYGYKQLPLERWVASPLYLLNENKGSNTFETPIRISLKRAELVEEEDPNELLDSESRKEELLIEEAIDREGTPAHRSLHLVFRTVDDNSDSYWLDSGIISI